MFQNLAVCFVCTYTEYKCFILHRLRVFSAESVPLFGPPLPSPPVFDDLDEFRDFLLVKREYMLYIEIEILTCNVKE